MKRPKLPPDVDHAELTDFALHAAWVAKLADTVDMLAGVCGDFLRDEALDRGEIEAPNLADMPVWEMNGFCVGAGVAEQQRGRSSASLLDRAKAWLAEGPEHWGIFKVVVLDPWQKPSGRWRKRAPM